MTKINNPNVKQARDEMIQTIEDLGEFTESPLVGNMARDYIQVFRHWVRLLETSEVS